MDFRTRSTRAAGEVLAALDLPPDGAQAEQVIRIIEQAVVAAVVEANERCSRVAKDCCGADRDMAHKIEDEIQRSYEALVANLSSLR